MLAEWNVAVIGAAGNAGKTFVSILPLALLGVLVVVVIHLLVAVVRRRAAVCRAPWGWWAWLVYLGTLASVAVLAVTSLVAVIQFGILGGWWLFAHMFGAGAFTLVLPLLALTWCEAHGGACPARPAGDAEPPPSARFSCLAKTMFWVILAAGLVVIGTMVLSMLPLFGTVGLELLLDIHRYAGLAVVAAMILHLYATMLPRLGLG